MQHTSPTRPAMGQRQFGAVNWMGLKTLYLREVRRFSKVYTQTILAPLVTAGLFMLVFTAAFGSRRGEVAGVPFAQFLAPGILMMTVIQNAFANTSSSIMISKIQGNIVDTLMPPLNAAELMVGYVGGGVTRGLVVAVLLSVVMFPIFGISVAYPFWAIWFVVTAGLMLSLLGMLAAIMAQKFDQMAAITNFVITPLSFLAGTFYSVSTLPDLFRALSQVNPFFYLIDGFRFGVLGMSDASPWAGFAVTGAFNLILGLMVARLIATGYRLKS